MRALDPKPQESHCGTVLAKKGFGRERAPRLQGIKRTPGRTKKGRWQLLGCKTCSDHWSIGANTGTMEKKMDTTIVYQRYIGDISHSLQETPRDSDLVR